MLSLDKKQKLEKMNYIFLFQWNSFVFCISLQYSIVFFKKNAGNMYYLFHMKQSLDCQYYWTIFIYNYKLPKLKTKINSGSLVSLNMQKSHYLCFSAASTFSSASLRPTIETLFHTLKTFDCHSIELQYK